MAVFRHTVALAPVPRPWLVDALAFQPMCNGRDASGLLAEGSSDPGFLELDAIELY